MNMTYYRIHYFVKEADKWGEEAGDRYRVTSEINLSKDIAKLQKEGKGIVSVGIYEIGGGKTSFERPKYKKKLLLFKKK